jgi:hypothetical protein
MVETKDEAMNETKIYDPRDLEICFLCGSNTNHVIYPDSGKQCNNKITTNENVGNGRVIAVSRDNPCFKYHRNRYEIFNCSSFPGLTKIDIEIKESIFDLWRNPVVVSIGIRTKSNEYKYAQVNQRLKYPIDIVDYFPELIEI